MQIYATYWQEFIFNSIGNIQNDGYLLGVFLVSFVYYYIYKFMGKENESLEYCSFYI